VPEVMTVLQEVLKQVREEGVTEEELRRCQAARRRAILELLGDSRRHGQLLGRYALLNHDLFVNLKAHSLSAITPDDVQSFASQILTPPNMAVASFGLDGNALASLL
jgi:predicted Zn-dependent peptidase